MKAALFISKLLLLNIIFLNYSESSSFLELEKVKIGLLKHSIKSGLRHAYEKNYDVNLEIMSNKVKCHSLPSVMVPRLHLGANLNFYGNTSVAYTGLTWEVDFSKIFFGELSLGGSVHNGNLKQKSLKKKALGSRFLFRESLALGIKLDGKKSVSLMVDHVSNANLARPNSGITNVGIVFGYWL